jgi:pimeloyl-ACP methyl ester carboxylesterase
LTFTAHRGGAGPPLLCLHGFLDTWRSWELALPALERHHDVELDGVGHCPQLDVPLETAQLIVGFTT